MIVKKGWILNPSTHKLKNHSIYLPITIESEKKKKKKKRKRKGGFRIIQRSSEKWV